MTGVLKVLIVEDDEQMRYVCRRMLSKRYEVTAVSSCDEGIPRLRSEAYDIVLLDLKMAGMSPEHFLKMVKQEKPECPVIAMTGYPEQGLIARMLQNGASEFLAKPFDLDQLSAAINRCLASSRKDVAAPLKDKKILLVDDDETFSEIFSMVLTSRQARVTRTKDGAEALEVAKREKPDLIILDVVFPAEDGYAICAAMKAQQFLQDIPVILITGYSVNGVEEAIKAGAKGCLSKAASPFELLADIGNLLA